MTNVSQNHREEMLLSATLGAQKAQNQIHDMEINKNNSPHLPQSSLEHEHQDGNHCSIEQDDALMDVSTAMQWNRKAAEALTQDASDDQPTMYLHRYNSRARLQYVAPSSFNGNHNVSSGPAATPRQMALQKKAQALQSVSTLHARLSMAHPQPPPPPSPARVSLSVDHTREMSEDEQREAVLALRRHSQKKSQDKGQSQQQQRKNVNEADPQISTTTMKTESRTERATTNTSVVHNEPKKSPSKLTMFPKTTAVSRQAAQSRSKKQEMILQKQEALKKIRRAHHKTADTLVENHSGQENVINYTARAHHISTSHQTPPHSYQEEELEPKHEDPTNEEIRDKPSPTRIVLSNHHHSLEERRSTTMPTIGARQIPSSTLHHPPSIGAQTTVPSSSTSIVFEEPQSPEAMTPAVSVEPGHPQLYSAALPPRQTMCSPIKVLSPIPEHKEEDSSTQTDSVAMAMSATTVTTATLRTRTTTTTTGTNTVDTPETATLTAQSQATLYAQRKQYRSVVPVRVFLPSDDNFVTEYDSFVPAEQEELVLYQTMFEQATCLQPSVPKLLL